MNINVVDQQVSVSGQITSEDVMCLVEQGVEIVVCNRPDNEEMNQPTFDSIQAAALKAGVEIVNIPFAGGGMLPGQPEELAVLLKTGKRIHAYCRTGNRSTQLCHAAAQLL